MSDLPPPNYTLQDQDSPSESSHGPTEGPQVAIVPVANAVVFQTGNLGAEGETASLEGEVHIKGFRDGDWESVELTLKTVETTPSNTIELVTSKATLFSRTDATSSSSPVPRALPSALPFSMLLPRDSPQAVVTPVSSLTHTLTATLHPTNASASPVSTTIPVQIRRYTTPLAPFLPVAPRTLTLDSPTRISVQLPRTIWRVGETIPVYLTIPPPEQSVFQGGLRLRNVKAELIRIVKVGAEPEKAVEGSSIGEGRWEVSHGKIIQDDFVPATGAVATHDEKKGMTSISPPLGQATSSNATAEHARDGSLHTTVITRTGSSARFHSAHPVQLRLVLHGVHSEHDDGNDSIASDYDSATGSITQSTVLHHTSFEVHVTVSFVTAGSHASTAVHGTLPIIIIPPLAQHVEAVADDLEEKYMKKHDRPPTKTTRPAEEGPSAPPPFDASPSGYATPSGYPSGAGDPPPFSAELGTLALPTFQESQAAAGSSSYHPSASPLAVPWSPSKKNELRFEGEGTQFGFKPEDQYDGLSHSMALAGRSSPPPPAISDSANDQDVTSLAEMIEHHAGLEVVGALGTTGTQTGRYPPPPPALDDPMDPPPGIDDRFHSISRTEEERINIQFHAQAQAEPMAANHAHPPGDELAPLITRPPPYLGGAPEMNVSVGAAERQRRASAAAVAAAQAGPPPSYELAPQ